MYIGMKRDWSFVRCMLADLSNCLAWHWLRSFKLPALQIKLLYPYPAEVPESSDYTELQFNALVASPKPAMSLPISSASKEGYLEKLGGVRKNWKKRFFVSEKFLLHYYKDKQTKQPIRTLDLCFCDRVVKDETQGKPHCIALLMPARTYYLSAESQSECSDWFRFLQDKVDQAKQVST
eukprot:TRINITY_DN8307_c0_g1_i4.p1 TRINITY_DN8307_c0_g1~~TRINITY_DN8307_c0_g1_i4.p1  ORF type:complete len:179 (+),score=27.45 TRINITY_DN8307_c0_g1_i4:212-748(+)